MSVSKLYRSRIVPGAQELNTETRTIRTIAELKALPSPVAAESTYKVMGYNTYGDWDLPVYRWNAASTENSDPYVRPTNIPSNLPGRWEILPTSPVNARWFGVKGDGTVGDRDKLQSCVNYASSKGMAAYIPAGNYKIESPINLPSNFLIFGEGKRSVLDFAGSTNAFKLNKSIDTIIKDLSFIGDAESFAIETQESEDVTIENCHVSTACLYTNQNAVNYFLIDSTHYSKNIKIIGNTCVGPSKTGARGCIQLNFLDGATVKGNTIKTYPHGIYWFGGDSNPAVHGALANPRKTANLIIQENHVFDAFGGIWGAMGQKVSIIGNIVSNCDDVGIDFEGSFDSEAIGNIVSDCINGNFTTFSFCRNITFQSNLSTQTNSTFPHVRINLEEPRDAMTNVGTVIKNNTFSSRQSTGIGRVDMTFGGAGDLTVQGNNFDDCYLDLSSNAVANLVVKDNTFRLSKALITAALRADCNIAEGTIQVLNNTLQQRVAPRSGAGIRVTCFNPNLDQQVVLTDNKMYGFTNDIELVHISTNLATKGIFYVKGNLCEGGQIVIYRDGAGPNPSIYKAGNTTLLGVDL